MNYFHHKRQWSSTYEFSTLKTTSTDFNTVRRMNRDQHGREYSTTRHRLKLSSILWCCNLAQRRAKTGLLPSSLPCTGSLSPQTRCSDTILHGQLSQWTFGFLRYSRFGDFPCSWMFQVGSCCQVGSKENKPKHQSLLINLRISPNTKPLNENEPESSLNKMPKPNTFRKTDIHVENLLTIEA